MTLFTPMLHHDHMCLMCTRIQGREQARFNFSASNCKRFKPFCTLESRLHIGPYISLAGLPLYKAQQLQRSSSFPCHEDAPTCKCMARMHCRTFCVVMPLCSGPSYDRFTK